MPFNDVYGRDEAIARALDASFEMRPPTPDASTTER